MDLGKLDHRGLAEYLLGPEMRELTAAGARKGLDWAREHAEVGTPPGDQHPGEFRDSLHVVEGVRSSKGDRAAALLIADSDYAAAVEFGNQHRQGSHILEQAKAVIEAF